MNKKNLFLLLFCLAVLTSCSNAKKLVPEWSIQVNENTRLSIKDKIIYTVEDNLAYEVDSKNGSTIQVENDFLFVNIQTYGETNNSNELKNYKLTDNYSLVEHYNFIDDCQQSLHTYKLKKTSENKETLYLKLKKDNRFYVNDFKVIDNNLFIIISYGDIYHLNKYELN